MLEILPIDDWAQVNEITDTAQKFKEYNTYVKAQVLNSDVSDEERNSVFARINQRTEEGMRSAGLAEDEVKQAFSPKPFGFNRKLEIVHRALDAVDDPVAAQSIRDYYASSKLLKNDPNQAESFKALVADRQKLAEQYVDQYYSEAAQKLVTQEDVPFTRVELPDGQVSLVAGPAAVGLSAKDAYRKSLAAGTIRDEDIEGVINSMAKDENGYEQFRHRNFEEANLFVSKASKENKNIQAQIALAANEIAEDGALSDRTVTGFKALMIGHDPNFSRQYDDADIKAALEYTAGSRAMVSGTAEYDEENEENNIRKFGYGYHALHRDTILNNEKFEAATKNMSERDKKIVGNQRALLREAQFDQFNNSLSRSYLGEEWQSFLQKGLSEGKEKADILDEFTSSEAYSGAANIAQHIGLSIGEAVTDIGWGVGAILGSEGAREQLLENYKDRQARAEVAKLFGQDFGMGVELSSMVAPVLTDVATTMGLMAITGGAGAGLVVGGKVLKKGIAKQMQRSVLKEAVDQTDNAAIKTAINATGSGARNTAVPAMRGFASYYNGIVGHKATQLSSLFVPAATRSGSMTYAAVYDALERTPEGKNLTPEERHDKALAAGATAGMVTGIITTAFSFGGRGGLEDFVLRRATGKDIRKVMDGLAGRTLSNEAYNGVLKALLADGAKQFARRAAGKEIIKGFTDEALEEGFDEYLNTIVQAVFTNKDLPFEEVARSAYMGALYGGIFGAAVGPVRKGFQTLMDVVTPADPTAATQREAEVKRSIALVSANRLIRDKANSLKQADLPQTAREFERQMQEAITARADDVKQSTADKKATDEEPAAEEPAAEQPVDEEPVDEEPTATELEDILSPDELATIDEEAAAAGRPMARMAARKVADPNSLEEAVQKRKDKEAAAAGRPMARMAARKATGPVTLSAPTPDAASEEESKKRLDDFFSTQRDAIARSLYSRNFDEEKKQNSIVEEFVGKYLGVEVDEVFGLGSGYPHVVRKLSRMTDNAGTIPEKTFLDEIKEFLYQGEISPEAQSEFEAIYESLDPAYQKFFAYIGLNPPAGSVDSAEAADIAKVRGELSALYGNVTSRQDTAELIKKVLASSTADIEDEADKVERAKPEASKVKEIPVDSPEVLKAKAEERIAELIEIGIPFTLMSGKHGLPTLGAGSKDYLKQKTAEMAKAISDLKNNKKSIHYVPKGKEFFKWNNIKEDEATKYKSQPAGAVGLVASTPEGGILFNNDPVVINHALTKLKRPFIVIPNSYNGPIAPSLEVASEGRVRKVVGVKKALIDSRETTKGGVANNARKAELADAIYRKQEAEFYQAGLFRGDEAEKTFVLDGPMLVDDALKSFDNWVTANQNQIIAGKRQVGGIFSALSDLSKVKSVKDHEALRAEILYDFIFDVRSKISIAALRKLVEPYMENGVIAENKLDDLIEEMALDADPDVEGRGSFYMSSGVEKTLDSLKENGGLSIGRTTYEGADLIKQSKTRPQKLAAFFYHLLSGRSSITGESKIFQQGQMIEEGIITDPKKSRNRSSLKKGWEKKMIKKALEEIYQHPDFSKQEGRPFPDFPRDIVSAADRVRQRFLDNQKRDRMESSIQEMGERQQEQVGLADEELQAGAADGGGVDFAQDEDLSFDEVDQSDDPMKKASNYAFILHNFRNKTAFYLSGLSDPDRQSAEKAIYDFAGAVFGMTADEIKSSGQYDMSGANSVVSELLHRIQSRPVKPELQAYFNSAYETLPPPLRSAAAVMGLDVPVRLSFEKAEALFQQRVAVREQFTQRAPNESADVEANRAKNNGDILRLGLVDGDAATVTSALQKISRSGVDESHKAVAKLLLRESSRFNNVQFRIVDNANTNYAGLFTVEPDGTRRVTLNIAATYGSGVESVLLHEYLHAATHDLLRSDNLTSKQQTALRRLEALRSEVAAEYGTSGSSQITMDNGLSNIDEFISSLFTSPAFQENVRALPKRGFVQRILDAVRDLFGVPKKSVLARAFDDLVDFLNMEVSPAPAGFDAVEQRVRRNRASENTREKLIVDSYLNENVGQLRANQESPDIWFTSIERSSPTSAISPEVMKENAGVNVSGLRNRNSVAGKTLEDSQAMQRGFPEKFAVIEPIAKKQNSGFAKVFSYGATVYFNGFEHLGDLYHRVAKDGEFGAVRSKIEDNLLKFFRSGNLPLEQEIKYNVIGNVIAQEGFTLEQIRDAGGYANIVKDPEIARKIDIAEKYNELGGVMYAAMYSRLKAYTPAQALGRNIAIAYGMGRYQLAKDLADQLLQLESDTNGIPNRNEIGFNSEGVGNLEGRSDNQTKNQWENLVKIGEQVTDDNVDNILQTVRQQLRKAIPFSALEVDTNQLTGQIEEAALFTSIENIESDDELTDTQREAIDQLIDETIKQVVPADVPVYEVTDPEASTFKSRPNALFASRVVNVNGRNVASIIINRPAAQAALTEMHGVITNEQHVRQMLESILNEEIFHAAELRSIPKADLNKLADELSSYDLEQAIDHYTKDSELANRLKASVQNGDRVVMRQVVGELLRMKAQQLTRGYTTEEDRAFYFSNPKFHQVMFRFLMGVFRRMAAAYNLKKQNAEMARMVNKLSTEVRLLRSGVLRINQRMQFDALAPNSVETELEERFSATMEKGKLIEFGPDTTFEEVSRRLPMFEEYELALGAFKKGEYKQNKWLGRILNGNLDPRVLEVFKQAEAVKTAIPDRARSIADEIRKMVEADPELDHILLGDFLGRPNDTEVPTKFIEYRKKVFDTRYKRVSREKGGVTPSERELIYAEEVEEKVKIEHARLVSEAKKRKESARKKLLATHPELYSRLSELRMILDGLSITMAEKFDHSGELRAVIDENLGIYVTRSYKAFIEEGYMDKLISVIEGRKEGSDEVMLKRYEKVYEIFEQTYHEKWAMNQQKVERDNNVPEDQRTSYDELIKTSKYSLKLAIEERADPIRGAILDYLYSLDSHSQIRKGRPMARSVAKSVVDQIRQRKVVPQPIRELLGQYDDADVLDNILRSVTVVSRAASRESFIQNLIQLGQRSGFVYSLKEVQKMQKNGDQRYHSLVNLRNGATVSDDEIQNEVLSDKVENDYTKSLYFYIDKDAHEALQKHMTHQTPADLSFERQWVENVVSYYRMGIGLSLGAKTLGSLGFYIRNVFGNLGFFGPMQGVMPHKLVKHWSRVITALKTPKEVDEYAAELMAYNVIQGDIRARFTQELLQGRVTLQTLREDIEDTSTKIRKLKSNAKKAGKTVKEKTKPLTDRLLALSNAVDTFYKIAYFEHELDVLKKARAHDISMGIPAGSGYRLSDHELKKMAAVTVRNTSQSYVDAYETVKYMTSKYSFLLPPFIRFRFDVLRILFDGTPKQIRSEIDSDNPIIKKRGYSRLFGFTSIVGGFSIAAPLALRAIFGISDEEDELNREALPDYARNNTLFYMGDHFWNFTFMNPVSGGGADAALRMVEDTMRGKPSEGIMRAIKMMASEYAGEQILNQAVADVASNQDSRTGDPIYEEHDGVSAIYKVFNYIWKEAYEPRSLTATKRIINAAIGDEALDENRTVSSLLLNEIKPTRSKEFDVKRAFQQVLSKKRDERNRLSSKINRLKSRGALTDGDIETMAREFIEDRKRIDQDISRYVKAAMSRGMSFQQVRNSMKYYRMSNDRIEDIVKGRFKKPEVSATMKKDLQEMGSVGVERLNKLNSIMAEYNVYTPLHE